MIIPLLVKYGKLTFLSAQLEKPTGRFGRYITSKLLDKANNDLHQFCLEQMEIQEDHQLLDIGFGSGQMIAMMVKRLKSGKVTGIDFSKEMVRCAQKINSKKIKEGKVQIDHGDLGHLPYRDSRFDGVYTGNTIYFWSSPKKNAAEIMRVIRPGGKLFIAFRPKSFMENLPVVDQRFKLYAEDDIRELFASIGFKNIQFEKQLSAEGLVDCCAIILKY